MAPVNCQCVPTTLIPRSITPSINEKAAYTRPFIHSNNNTLAFNQYLANLRSVNDQTCASHHASTYGTPDTIQELHNTERASESHPEMSFISTTSSNKSSTYTDSDSDSEDSTFSTMNKSSMQLRPQIPTNYNGALLAKRHNQPHIRKMNNNISVSLPTDSNEDSSESDVHIDI